MPVQRRIVVQGPGTVKVLPANEDMLRLLRHPVKKVGFTNMTSPVTWPDDAFTKRRIRDGDVTVVDTTKKEEPPPQEIVVDHEEPVSEEPVS